jgi:hypothetical protein
MKRYFSFIGECLCREIREPLNDKTGAGLHDVQLSDGIIGIQEVGGDPRFVLLIEDRGDDRRSFLCWRDSFDCLPAVPVNEFGDGLRNALR